MSRDGAGAMIGIGEHSRLEAFAGILEGEGVLFRNIAERSNVSVSMF